jgi:hypothetical protein
MVNGILICHLEEDDIGMPELQNSRDIREVAFKGMRLPWR